MACPPTLHYWDDEGALRDSERSQEIADKCIQSMAEAIILSGGNECLSKSDYNRLRREHPGWQSVGSIRRYAGGFNSARKKALEQLASEGASVLPCGADSA